jgi:uncharacterized protein (TIGR02588 family)
VFVIYNAITASNSPPDIDVALVSVQQNRNGYLAIVLARNHGGSTAKGLVVEGEVTNGAQVLERSQTTLDYAPPKSEKQAGLFFTLDPRRYQLKLRALGYEEP